MNIEVKVWLSDILKAITEIEGFLLDGPQDFSSYEKDLRTKRAIERNIEIIGEAMSRILNANPEINLSNSRKIVDTRNRIIHGYDTVSDEIIWGITINHLSILKEEIKEIISAA